VVVETRPIFLTIVSVVAPVPQVRTQNFQSFTKGEFPILVCTDIAARGLDTTFVRVRFMLDNYRLFMMV